MKFFKSLINVYKQWFEENNKSEHIVEFKHYNIKYSKLTNLIEWFKENDKENLNHITSIVFLYKKTKDKKLARFINETMWGIESNTNIKL